MRLLDLISQSVSTYCLVGLRFALEPRAYGFQYAVALYRRAWGQSPTSERSNRPEMSNLTDHAPTNFRIATLRLQIAKEESNISSYHIGL